MMRAVWGWILGICLIGVVWFLVSALVSDPSMFPGPFTVLRLCAGSMGTLSTITARTAMLALSGLAIATSIAAITTIAIALFPRSEFLIYPYIVMLKASPAVAFAPLLVVLFGSGNTVKIIVSAMISFFPMVIGGIDGIKRTPDRLCLVAVAYGCHAWARLRHFQSGYALSGFMSGMKTSAPLSVVGAIVGEYVDASAAGESGIGVFIAVHARSVYIDHVFAGVLLATALGLLFFVTVTLAAHILEGRLRLGR